jgi:ElaB/YqjD/DUF883 family membrane-anchored ribosome-binding protein
MSARKTPQSSSIMEAVQDGAQGVAEASTHIYNTALDQTQATAKQVQRYVRTNPWYALGIAAGAGILLGYMLGRRSS